MADRTPIEWTDATWTPIRARTIELQNDGSGLERIGWHCEHLSEGCRNCYAERLNARLGTRRPFKPAELKHRTRLGDPRGSVDVFLDEGMLGQPQRWRKPRDIFVCSMTDLFADFVSDEIIDQVFAVMAESPWHRFQVLTKRAKRMRAYMATPNRGARVADAIERLNGRDIIRVLDDPEPWPLPHVILMVSAESQREADERIPELLETPAACFGVSLEPLLGAIDLTNIRPTPAKLPKGIVEVNGTGSIDALRGTAISSLGIEYALPARLQWVIAGGESGPRARPMHPDWVRGLRDQCAASSTPFLFKQWGEWIGVPDLRRLPGSGGPGFGDFDHRRYDMEHEAVRVGRKASGRLLDGRTHDDVPEVQR